MIGRSKTEGTAAIVAIRPHVESTVSNRISELLVGDVEVWTRAAEHYRSMTEIIAESLHPGFTTTAVNWWRHSAGTIPNMRLKPESNDTPDNVHGEEK